MVNRKSRGSNRGVRMLLNLSITILTIGIAVIFYVIVVYGIKKGGDYSYNFAYQLFGDVAVEQEPGRDVKITIMKGESTMNIASKLEDAKLIVNKYSFFVKLKLRKYEVMPGTFVLNTSMTYDQILDTISDYGMSISEETTVEDTESAP